MKMILNFHQFPVTIACGLDLSHLAILGSASILSTKFLICGMSSNSWKKDKLNILLLLISTDLCVIHPHPINKVEDMQVRPGEVVTGKELSSSLHQSGL